MIKEEINLLPSAVRRARRRRLYHGRANRLFWVAIVSLGLIGLTYGVVYGVLVYFRSELDRQLVVANGSSAEVAQQVKETNQLLRAVDERVRAHQTWTRQLAQALRLVPAEVTVTSISLREVAVAEGDQAAGATALSITGRSASRTAIVDLDRRLGDLPWVARVEAPLKNLATGPQATFTFTIFRQDPGGEEL